MAVKVHLKRHGRSGPPPQKRKLHSLVSGQLGGRSPAEKKRIIVIAAITIAALVIISLFLIFGKQLVGKAYTVPETGATVDLVLSADESLIELKVNSQERNINGVYLELIHKDQTFDFCSVVGKEITSLLWNEFQEIKCENNKLTFGDSTLSEKTFKNEFTILGFPRVGLLESNSFELKVLDVYESPSGKDLFPKSIEPISLSLELKAAPGAPKEKVTCLETLDEGKDYFAKGAVDITTDSFNPFADVCTSDNTGYYPALQHAEGTPAYVENNGFYLLEYYCKSPTEKGWEIVDCREQTLSNVKDLFCNQGACDLASCQEGYASCDNNLKNGCEVNVNTDVNNCGWCGMKCEEGQSCVSGFCTKEEVVTCTDPDENDPYTQRTTVTLGTQSKTDACVNDNDKVLTEYYCLLEDGEYNFDTVSYDCSQDGKVCQDGACVKKAVEDQESCTDGDGGQNYNVVGKVTYITPEGQDQSAGDSCFVNPADGKTYLNEFYCEGQKKKSVAIDCASLGAKKCQGNACVPEGASFIIKAEEVEKLKTKITAGQDLNKIFWIFTTVKDAEGTIVLFNKEQVFSMKKDEEYVSTLAYKNPEKINKKIVVIYDHPDPNQWTVYLDKKFIHQYAPEK